MDDFAGVMLAKVGGGHAKELDIVGEELSGCGQKNGEDACQGQSERAEGEEGATVGEEGGEE